MIILSAIAYVFACHPFLAWLGLILLGVAFSLVMVARGGRATWFLSIIAFFVAGQINIFTGHIFNALFLNAVGVTGSAVVVQERETSSTLNDQNIWAYEAVLRTADGRDVKTRFTTMSASTYPIRNEILIPPQGERFVVKYVPGFERNMVIMSDLSDYGKRRLIRQDRAPVEKAAAQLAASPANREFLAEYRAALETFLGEHRQDADPMLILDYEQRLAALGSPR